MHTKTESPKQSEWSRRKRARVQPRSEEQMRDRHVVASGEHERHDENIMRDIHIRKRGSETANEEQSDKLRKPVRFEQEAPDTSSSSTMHVSLEHPASGERQDRPEPVFVQNLGHVHDDMHISAFPRKRWTKESLHQRSVGLVSRRRCQDLRIHQLYELIENMTALSSLDEKI